MEWYLPVIWAGLIGTAVLLYVVLDGFDLGIAILFPTTRDEGERDQMMNSVAPFWDGNETWLVLGGGGLWVAFPTAYAIIMPAFYLPVTLMLLALIFRGVAFEFRWVAKPRHKVWDLAFWLGSTMAAFSQGLILGGMIQGITVVDRQFAGGPFDWFTPFTLMCGAGVVVGYALLGATWLIYKTEGRVAERARAQAKVLLLGLLAFALIVSLWTPYAHPRIAERWFTADDAVRRPRLAAPARPARVHAVCPDDRDLRALLPGARDLELPLSGAAGPDDLGRRGSALLACLRADRRDLPAADDSVLHRLRVLDLPRQGEGRQRLSLRGRSRHQPG